MNIFNEQVALEKPRALKVSLGKLKWPPSPEVRHLLAFLHSGDILRQWLPKLMRISLAVWFIICLMLWIASWPALYQEFERWGLVKAFFASMISLGTAFFVFRITILRAGHLQSLPSDDFVALRAFAVLCRWAGEFSLLSVLGAGLSHLLQPISASLNSDLGKIVPKFAAEVSSGTPELLLISAPLSAFFVSMTAVLFLVLYSVATAIDVALAIEFNTRAERVKGRLS